MKERLEKYLESRRLAWSETTLRSERLRLGALVAAGALDGNPQRLWEHLEAAKPYTRVTAWTVVTRFWDFAAPAGPNPYRVFRQENAKAFKHAYRRRPARLAMEEARAKLAGLADPQARELAEFLLLTGCRFCEHETFDGEQVVGKGGKARDILAPNIVKPKWTRGYQAFYYELRKVGLTPHLLRKVHATWLSERGADPYQIAEVMGHASVETTMCYVAANKKKIRGIYAAGVR